MGENVTMKVSATDPNNDRLNYRWQTSAGQIMGQGSSVVLDTSGIQPSADPMTVTVRLTVSDGQGGAASDEKVITVAPGSVPAPSFPDTTASVPLPADLKPLTEALAQKRALVHLGRAEALFNQRQYDAAIRELERGLKLDPQNTVLQEKKATIEKVRDILNKPGG
jgi:hypothetical protein